MKTLKSILVGLTIFATVLSTTPTTTATSTLWETVDPYDSIFTPDRPAEKFVEGIQGFSYATFNNFINNPNISNSGRRKDDHAESLGDERLFLLGGKCEGDEKNHDCKYLVNTITEDLNDGDILIFEIYFHNNAEDPDSSKANSENTIAKNVKIGMDFNNVTVDKTTYSEVNIVRPEGFIYADNNEYRTSKNDEKTVILDPKSNTIKTATDDMQIEIYKDEEITLVPLDEASLAIGKNQTKSGDTPIFNEYIEATAKTINIKKSTINVTKKFENNKVWIEFDKLPGCFAYSGYAYFYAKVVKEKPICKALTLKYSPLTEELNLPIPSKNTNYYKLEVTNLDFPNAPDTAKFLWESSDKTGKFYTPKTDGTFSATTGSAETSVINTQNIVYYDGAPGSTVTVKIIDAGDADVSKCSQSITIPKKTVKTPVCTSLTATQKKLKTAEALALGLPNPDKNDYYKVDITSLNVKDGPLPSTAKLLWDSTDPASIFYIPEKGKTTFKKEPIGGETELDQKTVYYTGKSDATITVKVIGADKVGDCISSFKIYKEPQDKTNVCEELKASVTPDGEYYKISIDNLKFTKGSDPAEYPKNTEIKFSSSSSKSEFFVKLPTAVPYLKKVPLKIGKDGKAEISANAFSEVLYKRGGDEEETITITVWVNGKKEKAVPCTYTVKIPQKVTPQKKTCENMTFSAVESPLIKIPKKEDSSKPVTCLSNDKKYFLTATFYEDAAKTKQIKSDTVKVKWHSTDPNGKFYSTKEYYGAAKPIGSSGYFTGEPSVIYVGGGQVNAMIYKWDDKVYYSDKCKTKIEPCANGCASLDIFSSERDIRTGDAVSLSVTGKDLQGGELPKTTKISWSTNTDGVFDSGKSVFETTLDKAVSFGKSTKEGTISAFVSKSDPLYAEICKDSVQVNLKPVDINCRTITVENYGSPLTKIERGTLYKLSAKSAYSVEYPKPTVTYTSTAGVFYALPENPDSDSGRDSDDLPPSLKPAVTMGIESLLKDLMSLIGVNYASNKDLPTGFKTSITVPDGTPVFFISFYDAEPNSYLTVKSTDFSNEECVKTYKMEGICETLLFETMGKKPFDPSEKYTIINLVGKYINHTGPIEITLTGKGKISKVGDEINQSNKVTFTKDDYKLSKTQMSIVYYKDESYDPTKDTVELYVKAVGASAGVCEDTLKKYSKEEGFTCENLDIILPKSPWNYDKDEEQSFQIDVDTKPAGHEKELKYNWETSDGTWKNGEEADKTDGVLTNKLENYDEATSVKIWAEGFKDTCLDTIKIHKDDEEPEIEKTVYLKGHPDEADDLLNIGGNKAEKYKYLTYRVEFSAGSAETVEISETSAEDNGKIYGNLNGYFQIEEMRINVNEGNREKGYTILKTEGYDNDSDDDDYKKDNNLKLAKYEDKYKCGDNRLGDDLCIDGDFDEVINDFKDGDPIKFENLTPDTEIIIKYQVKNESKISENYCKTLTTAEGCGEEIKNKIVFKAESETREDYTGNASAEVIVICPYVLTRQGGDVFFHDAIDTGVDVAYCSEVKGSTGIIITPIEIFRQFIKSGAGDLPEEALSLDLPSHDVCRYSNMGTNIEGYNDVLKHFSSTVCELKADVAAQWQEENINSAMSANITRISRWGENLLTDTINNTVDLNGTTNLESGVFVRSGDLHNGDLHIGTSGEFTINSSSEGIPAGQTYIVTNGDLYIDSNIKYGETDYMDPNKIPSAAFIVINGDIIISNEVTQIDGILMAVDLNKEVGNEKGRITNAKTFDETATTENRLTVNGSMVGNVYELFLTRTGVGDPTKDEGSVTIKYDERILLNTPPGLGELINVNQAVVPN